MLKNFIKNIYKYFINYFYEIFCVLISVVMGWWMRILYDLEKIKRLDILLNA